MQDLQSDRPDDERMKVLAAQELARSAMLEEMRAERNELVEHFNRDTDLKSKELVQGIHKVCVLGVIKYHQIKQTLWEEVSMHPEVLKGLEELHYHVEHNIPVEKEMLYTLVPELYIHQINKLGAEDR